MGFEQLLKRLALADSRGWLGALGVALGCVLACTLIRAALTPLLGSLGGTTIFLPAVIVAGLWAGRRGAYMALLLGIAAAWALAWLHPDPINLRQFLIGVLLVVITGAFAAEVAAALRKALGAEAAAVSELEHGQHRLRLAHEAGALGTWEWDIATDTLNMSDGYLRNWRILKENRLAFLDVAAKVHPDDHAAILESRRRVLEDGEAYRSEYRVVMDDGSVRWFSSRGEPVQGGDGKVVRVHGVSRDITEQREAETVLRESEARFRTMANSAPSPVWVTRPEGGIEFVNEGFTEFFGLSRDQLLGDVWIGLLHPKDRERVVAVIQAERSTGKPYEFEARFLSASGEYRWAQARCRPRLGPDGQFMGYVGIAFDVTEAREAQDFLRRQERRQRFLLQLGDGLRETDEPRDIAAFAERSLGRHLHVARAGYGELDIETGVLSVGDSWTDGVLEPISGDYSIESYGAALVAELRKGRTVRVDDTAKDPRTAESSDAFQSEGVRARLSVPVVRGGRTVAVFFLHDTAPRSWTDEETLLVEEAATRTWTEIERARALAEVRESEARFRSISDSAPILVWVTNADRTRAFVNHTYVEFMGGTYEDCLVGDWRTYLHPEDWDRILAEQVAGEGSLQPFSLEARYKRADGTYRWLRSFSRPRFGREEELLGFVGAAYDVTEERQVQADLQHINDLLADRVSSALAEKEQAEAALIRAQKLEALGRLTGGVAHDFNNLLTVVVGALDMILKHPNDEAKRTRMAEAAMAAARRGEQLTHQLLAFSRRQALRPALTDINALIREGEPLIRRAVGETVEFDCRLSPGQAVVRVDPAQFEAALFNLVVNARDATPDGGRISVVTERRTLAEGEIAEVPAGTHIVIRVSDTGAGMDETTLGRVFEPFFTTKPQGKGTGLGLSQVYGFAQQSGGGVTIDSSAGKGSTVAIYLPASAEVMAEAIVASANASPAAGPLKILLVEDDVEVAEVAEAMLRHLGHEVVRVGSAARALAKLRSKTPFDLMLSDVVMPGQVNGVELAHRATEMRPDLKIVLTSGYAGEKVDATLVQAPWPFLRKPYSQTELVAILDAALAPAAASKPASARKRPVKA